MKIGIVNAGNIGLNLTVSWVRRGHEVMVSKDTHPEQLQERVRQLVSQHNLSDAATSRIHFGTLVQAADFSDVVVLAAYFPRFTQVLDELRRSGVTFASKTLIDTMNPLNIDANFNHYHDTEYMARTSTTEDLQKAFPQAKIVKAFSTVPAQLLDIEKWASNPIPAMIYLGGDSSTDLTVRTLIEDAGFKPNSAGHEIKDARLLETLGVLLHRLVENEYQGDLNVAFDVVRPSK